MKPVVVAFGLLAFLSTRPIPSAGSEPVRLPDGSTLANVEFDRHVASLFGRLGCNAGACHGSFQGRGGLNLSLFGHDPARDYRALTHAAHGRRIAILDPDRSLVLLKATGQVPHEGGQRFEPDSWEYQVIRAWIAAGARRDPSEPATVAIEFRPPESNLTRPGGTARISVLARFADGSESDVTAFADMRIRDPDIAHVSNDGKAQALRPGDTTIVAAYNGLVASASIIVPTGNAGSTSPLPSTGLVDREVNAKLRTLGIEASSQATDAEFLRRITLDVIGFLPTPNEVRDFLNDTSTYKRSKAIDRLLAHPMHAALWATRYLDITGCDEAAMEGPDELRPRLAREWHDWFRARFNANLPYDQMVRGILCATSRGGEQATTWARHEAERINSLKAGKPTGSAQRPQLDLFWRRLMNGELAPIEPTAERVATAFLGVRIECAQCHKHPFDRWTQTDYRAFANTVANVQFGLSNEALAATATLLEERRRLREVYLSNSSDRRLDDPDTGRPLAAKALGGPELIAEGDPREQLFEWLTTPDNPYFARSFVNRVWAVYFGSGLVDPVDGFSVANPPSNPRLLDALAADFIAHGYDIRRLERLVLDSMAYQRSSDPVAGNGTDTRNFARSVPRPLPAEVLVDALNAAIGVPGDFSPDAPKGSRAIEVATNRARSPDLARAFRVFGKPQRKAICDCERPKAPALPQTLFLMSDQALIAKLGSGRVRTLAQSKLWNAQAVDELFLATLSRFPSWEETRAALDHLRAEPDRASGLADMLWALINTREFVLEH
jgi:hypothetical protein